MPLDYSNPSTLKFLIENLEKEQDKRLIWFIKNKDELLRRSAFPDNYADIRTQDVRKTEVSMGLCSLAAGYYASKINHRKKPIRDGLIHGAVRFKPSAKLETHSRGTIDSLALEPVMLPVEPNVKDLIYQDLPFGGRHQYLRMRKYKIPEDKYYYDQTSSNVIGWRLKDSEFSRQPATYGRYCTFIHDMNSRSGPQPDPAHYQKPPNHPFSKCVF